MEYPAVDITKLPPELQDRVLWERSLGRESLYDFMLMAWGVLEPGTQFDDNWHIGAIAEHLEAVSRGEIPRLVINIPPRCMKSLSVSVCWQPWEWTQEFFDEDGNPINVPERGAFSKWLFASYTESLTIRDNVKARRLIQSEWYQNRWGHCFSLAGDQNAKTRFDNDLGAYRIATAVGAMATGEGGDYQVIDDPHNVHQGESDTVREGTVLWLTETMSTRFNNKRGRRVIVMQRVHERDCSGHVLAEGGYVHLCLPMRFERSRLVPFNTDRSPNEDYVPPTPLGFVDPREEEGELLWPNHFDEEYVTDRLEAEMGPYAVAGQHQQRPTPRGGGMFKRKNLQVISSIHEGVRLRVVRGWDFAGTDPEKEKNINDPAYTVGLLMGKEMGVEDNKARIYILDVVRGRWDPGERDETVVQVAHEDSEEVTIWIEQEPGQSGKSQIHHFRELLPGFAVNPPQQDYMPTRPDQKDRPLREVGVVTGNKVQRAEPFATAVHHGRVYILRGPWNKAYIHELVGFPLGAKKDQVDASSLCYNRLTVRPMSTMDALRLKGYGR